MNDIEAKACRQISLTDEAVAKTPPPAAGGSAANARVIAISSGKCGVGKSSISVNLCIALAQQGHRVCLLDADTNLANVGVLMGLAPRFTLQDFLSGERAIDEILVDGPGGVSLVPAASGVAEFIHLDAGQQEQLLSALLDLERRFDYLIIDTAAGFHQQVIQFLLAAPHNILVVTPDPTSLTDAFSLMKVLKRHYFEHPVHVIVNMVSGLPAAHDAYRRLTQTAAKFLQLDIRYLGYVLADQQLAKSVRSQQPLLLQRPAAVASRCLQAIGNRLQQVIGDNPPDGESFSQFFQQQLYPQATAEAGEQPSVDTGPASAETPSAQTKDSGDRAAGLLAGVYYANLLGAREGSDNN